MGDQEGRSLKRRRRWLLLVAAVLILAGLSLFFRRSGKHRPLVAARGVMAALPQRAVPDPSKVHGWRGDGTGHYPDAKPPLHWSPTENVVWKTPLPGLGNATPVVIDDRVFVTAEPTTLLAVRLSDGGLLWQHQVTIADTLSGADRTKREQSAQAASTAEQRLQEIGPELEKLRRQARSGGASAEAQARLKDLKVEEQSLRSKVELAIVGAASPGQLVGMASSTPVSDGKSVFALFGNYIVAAFTIDGELRWARSIERRPDGGEPQRGGAGTGQAASPLLVDGRLIVPLTRLNAFDPETGDQLWEGDEFSDFGTPAVARIDGATLLITAEGRAVDVTNGRTMAEHLGDLWWLPPIVSDHDVFFISGAPLIPDRAAAAVRLPKYTGQPFTGQPLWSRPLSRTDRYASPLLLPSGDVLTIDNGQLMTVLNAKTGETIHERKLRNLSPMPTPQVWASPALVDPHVFIFDETGFASILNAQAPFDVVATNQLEAMHGSPVFAGTKLILRGLENLYCLEAK